MTKERVDKVLVDRGLAESRTKAQALIMAGMVVAGDKRVDKAGTMIPLDQPITVKGADHPWVSRGGQKLAHAIDHFGVSFDGKTVIDVGASTGGFTDVALAKGAVKVYAVDVGHGQLAWKLRSDDRVEVLERTNARYLTSEHIPEPMDIIVCDASFIGLETLLPAVLALAADKAVLIALIKPQFEVGKGLVGKGGVVRDPAQHQAVCARMKAWLNNLPGWNVLGITESPITGPEGNKEFLIAGQYQRGR